MTGERERLEETRDQALRDLLDLERQVTEGELPPDAAAPLRAGYERTAAAAIGGLEELDGRPVDEPAEQEPAERAGRAGPAPARGRWALYALALAAVAFAAAVLLPGNLAERVAGGAVSGNEALGTAAPPSGVAAPRDLSSVTTEEMEAVVEENPGIVGMRLALAHRYLDAGDYLAATRHYLVAIRLEPRNVEALGHYGWLTLQLGDAEQAMDYVDRALAQDPRDVESLWFRANIALFGLSDPATATATLERMQELPGLEPGVRDQVAELLRTARSRSGTG